MRNTTRYKVDSPHNSLWNMYKTVSFWKVAKCFSVISVARITPFLSWKLWMFRHLLGMKVGNYTSFALMTMPDAMFPERIQVGSNCIIGYNTTILTHEYLIEEYRLGDVVIGDHVMIGANCTILPGVTIGDGAIIGAGTVVSKDIPPHSFVIGNPLVIRSKK